MLEHNSCEGLAYHGSPRTRMSLVSKNIDILALVPTEVTSEAPTPCSPQYLFQQARSATVT